jgi:hypothetical protein
MNNSITTGLISAPELTNNLINILGNLEEIETTPCINCDKTRYVAFATAKNLPDNAIEKYILNACRTCPYNNLETREIFEKYKTFD